MLLTKCEFSETRKMSLSRIFVTRQKVLLLHDVLFFFNDLLDVHRPQSHKCPNYYINMYDIIYK